jgi:hypothetical protein
MRIKRTAAIAVFILVFVAVANLFAQDCHS